jgi:hypothetical protein
MKIPYWLLRLLPMWDYVCPKCKQEVKKNSHKCLHCGEQYGEPVRVPPKILGDPKALEDYVHKHVFPRVSKTQRDYLTQYFTELFSDGFESGDFSAWTNTYGSPSVVSTQSYQGTYSAYKSASASSHHSVYKDISDQSVLNARMYFRLHTLPSSSDSIILIVFCPSSSWTNLGMISVRNDAGTYKLKVDSSVGESPTANGEISLSADTWHCIELHETIDTSEGALRGYFDGDEIASVTGVDTGSGDIGRVATGCRWTTYATELWWDCVVVADTYIGQEGETYTKTWTIDALFKKLGITKSLGVDTSFQKQDIPETFGIDADFLKRDITKSFTVDACFGALVTHTISRQIDVLLKKLDATKTFGLDTYFEQAEAETYAKTFGLDIIFAYRVRLPELWLDENGKIVLNISKPYTWVGT